MPGLLNNYRTPNLPEIPFALLWFLGVRYDSHLLIASLLRDGRFLVCPCPAMPALTWLPIKALPLFLCVFRGLLPLLHSGARHCPTRPRLCLRGTVVQSSYQKSHLESDGLGFRV